MPCGFLKKLLLNLHYISLNKSFWSSVGFNQK